MARHGVLWQHHTVCALRALCIRVLQESRLGRLRLADLAVHPCESGPGFHGSTALAHCEHGGWLRCHAACLPCKQLSECTMYAFHCSEHSCCGVSHVQRRRTTWKECAVQSPEGVALHLMPCKRHSALRSRHTCALPSFVQGFSWKSSPE